MSYKLKQTSQSPRRLKSPANICLTNYLTSSPYRPGKDRYNNISNYIENKRTEEQFEIDTLNKTLKFVSGFYKISEKLLKNGIPNTLFQNDWQTEYRILTKKYNRNLDLYETAKIEKDHLQDKVTDLLKEKSQLLWNLKNFEEKFKHCEKELDLSRQRKKEDEQYIQHLVYYKDKWREHLKRSRISRSRSRSRSRPKSISRSRTPNKSSSRSSHRKRSHDKHRSRDSYSDDYRSRSRSRSKLRSRRKSRSDPKKSSKISKNRHSRSKSRSRSRRSKRTLSRSPRTRCRASRSRSKGRDKYTSYKSTTSTSRYKTSIILEKDYKETTTSTSKVKDFKKETRKRSKVWNENSFTNSLYSSSSDDENDRKLKQAAMVLPKDTAIVQPFIGPKNVSIETVKSTVVESSPKKIPVLDPIRHPMDVISISSSRSSSSLPKQICSPVESPIRSPMKNLSISPLSISRNKIEQTLPQKILSPGSPWIQSPKMSPQKCLGKVTMENLEKPNDNQSSLDSRCSFLQESE